MTYTSTDIDSVRSHDDFEIKLLNVKASTGVSKGKIVLDCIDMIANAGNTHWTVAATQSKYETTGKTIEIHNCVVSHFTVRSSRYGTHLETCYKL